MDTITHGIFGSLVGSSARKKFKNLPPVWVIFISFFANIFPDFDFLFRLISEQAYFDNHRGITHSVILLPAWALLLVLFWVPILKEQPFIRNKSKIIINKPTIFQIYLISCLGILSHIFLDLVTSYGTMILSPFNNTKYEYGSLYIIDLFFSGIIVVGLLLTRIVQNQNKKYIISSIFLFFSLLYIGGTQLLKEEAKKIAETSLKNNNIEYYKINLYPIAFNPLSWRAVATNKNLQVYHIANFSIPNKANELPWSDRKKWGYNTILNPIAQIALNHEKAQNVKNFLHLPALISFEQTTEKICFNFEDLRFFNKFSSNPFVYAICTHKNGKITTSRIK